MTKYISEGRSAFKIPDENAFDDPDVDKEEQLFLAQEEYFGKIGVPNWHKNKLKLYMSF